MWMIIGYGNPLRSDDRFGLEVCKELESHSAIEDLAEIIVAHQLTPELIESVSQASGVIFVDASIDLAPGQLQFTLLNQTSDQMAFNKPPINSLYSHHYTPQTILKGAQALYGHSPQGWLCTIGGTHFELGEELSPLIKNTVTRASQLIFEKLSAPEIQTTLKV